MATIDGVEDSLVHAIVAKCSDRIFVVAIFDLVFNKEESGPKVVDHFLRLPFYAHESVYVRVGGWN